MQRLFFFFVCLAFLTLPWSAVHAKKLPPSNAQPLSAILKAIEEQNLGQIIDAEFDDGLWEVKIFEVQNYQKLYLDPITGQEVRPRKIKNKVAATPPANALALSNIVESLEKDNLGPIVEVEYEDGFWEVKWLDHGRESKIYVHPLTGQPQ